MNNKICIALTLYLTSLFASNTLGLKLMPFLWGTHLSVAILFFPFVYITTDVIGQVYGARMAKNFVFAGFLSLVVFLLYSLFSAVTPWSADSLWVKDAYNTVFGISARITIASLLAYVIGEYQDALSFLYFKSKTKGTKFWLTSNLSNVWSQFLDTFIFMLVAFAGVYSWLTIVFADLAWWAYKIAMGIVYTPLSYLYIKWLTESNEYNTNQNKNI
jgi:uncharacterized integral membrane protein (TIGR00697 family)